MKPTKPKPATPPPALTVEWCGSYHVEFDAESVASDLDDGAAAVTDAAIHAAIANNATAIAYAQSPAWRRVRGIGAEHIAAVRKILGTRQHAVLAALRSHGMWHAHAGWVWDTHANTQRILDTLVKAGYVTVETVEIPRRQRGIGGSRAYVETRTVYKAVP